MHVPIHPSVHTHPPLSETVRHVQKCPVLVPPLARNHQQVPNTYPQKHTRSHPITPARNQDHVPPGRRRRSPPAPPAPFARAPSSIQSARTCLALRPPTPDARRRRDRLPRPPRASTPASSDPDLDADAAERPHDRTHAHPAAFLHHWHHDQTRPSPPLCSLPVAYQGKERRSKKAVCHSYRQHDTHRTPWL